MPNLKRFEPIAFLLLLAALGYAFSGAIPGSELHKVSQVEILAVYGAVSAVAALLMLRFLPVRRFALERFVYAAFLGAMPLVYLSAALLQHADSRVAVELVGVPVFVGLALFGYFRSFPALGIGIVAHGVGWDLWHHGSTPYIAAWYPFMCLLADLTLGFLALTQTSAHKASPKEKGTE